MEWLWTVIAMAVAGGATYLIARLGLSGKIGRYVERIEDIEKSVTALALVTLAAFKPDEDGLVRLTEDEITRIKDAIANLLDLFGIELPFEA